MLSAVIRSEHSYPAMPLAGQQVHQRSVRSGPLVLRTNPFKNQRLQQIGDQPVLQRSDNFVPTITCGSDYTFPDFSSVGTDVLAKVLPSAPPANASKSLRGLAILYVIDGITNGSMIETSCENAS